MWDNFKKSIVAPMDRTIVANNKYCWDGMLRNCKWWVVSLNDL